MKNECILNLLNYKVEKIHFDLNSAFVMPNEDEKIEISPKLARKIEKIAGNRCKVSLGFVIGEEDSQNTPFSIEIWTSGEFEVENWEENDNIVKVNAVAVLFPFLRALLATITSNANIPPYILPVFNIVAWFEEEEKKLKATKK